MHEFTLVRCVNSRLSEELAFFNHDILRDLIYVVYRFGGRALRARIVVYSVYQRVTRIFLATKGHCHDRAAIKIHIAHFTLVYKTPYRRARAWPSECAREQRLHTRYPIVARALGRVRARAKVSCIQEQRYLAYKNFTRIFNLNDHFIL